MSDHDHSHGIKIPRGVLIAIGLVLFATIAGVAWFRASGLEPTAQVPQADQAAEVRQLRFVDSTEGTVSVFEVREGQEDRLIQVIQPGEGGFIRGVLRSLARARRASGISDEQPFVLIRQGNGELLLEDPMTSQRIYLQAFGPDNIEAFKILLADGNPGS